MDEKNPNIKPNDVGFISMEFAYKITFVDTCKVIHNETRYDIHCKLIGYSKNFCVSLLIPNKHTKNELSEKISEVVKSYIYNKIGQINV